MIPLVKRGIIMNNFSKTFAYQLVSRNVTKVDWVAAKSCTIQSLDLRVVAALFSTCFWREQGPNLLVLADYWQCTRTIKLFCFFWKRGIHHPLWDHIRFSFVKQPPDQNYWGSTFARPCRPLAPYSFKIMDRGQWKKEIVSKTSTFVWFWAPLFSRTNIWWEERSRNPHFCRWWFRTRAPPEMCKAL